VGDENREQTEKMTNQAAVQSGNEEEPTDDQKPSERGKGEGGRRRSRAGRGGAESSVDLDELRQLVELIDRHGFTEFEIEREGIRIRLRRELTPQVIQSAPPAPPAARPATGEAAPPTPAAPPAASTPVAEAPQRVITSPIVGTFYRSPSPDAEPFVNIGSTVTPDTIVCIIEAMKLMNEIQAEHSGVIKEILVENAQAVEFGQPLFILS
jgi:acetyl-CoA carboxylase biotin carboxyl carrier protein